jgi:hypothetical protein
MTLINIRNLGVTLSAPLFSRLDLSVNAGDRIGLVAANGPPYCAALQARRSRAKARSPDRAG